MLLVYFIILFDCEQVLSINATDSAGNSGSVSHDKTYVVDTKAPSVVIETSNSSILAIDETAPVTFTFDEDTAADSFTESDVTSAGGNLSNLIRLEGTNTWTATFTKDASDTSPSITVANNAYTDIAGNLGSGATQTWNADVVRPTVSMAFDGVTSVDSTVDAVVERYFNHTLTFNFSENVGSSFRLSDVTITGEGVLSNLVKVGPTQYTATYTAPSIDSNVTFAINNDKFSDIAGNLNRDGSDADNAIQVTVAAPAAISLITISDDFISPNKAGSDNTATNHYGVSGQYTGLIADSRHSSNLPTFSNDSTPTVAVTLSKALLPTQVLTVTRQVVDAQDNVLSAMTLPNPVPIDNIYSFVDTSLSTPTTGTTYRYFAEINGIGGITTSARTTQFILDTVAEHPTINGETIAQDMSSASPVLRGFAEISGTVFFDTNGNGLLDVTEVSTLVDNSGNWSIATGQLKGKFDLDTDGIASTPTKDKVANLAFVDLSGNTADNSDFARLYYFDLADGVGTLGPRDEPVGATLYNNFGGTNGRISLNVNGDVNTTTGGVLSDVMRLPSDGSDKIIISTGSFTSTGNAPYAIFTGTGNDYITIGGNQAELTRIYMEGGNDTYEAERIDATNRDVVIIDMGVGNDTVSVTTNVNNVSIYLRDGDDTINIGGNVDGVISGKGGLISLGAGADTATIRGSFTRGDLYTDLLTYNANGVFTGMVDDGAIDTVNITTLNSNDVILNLGAGDVLNISNALQAGIINYAQGVNNLTLNGMSGGTVNMNNGTDALTIKGELSNGTINMGAGSDTFSAVVVSNGTVNMGAGNDTLNITSLTNVGGIDMGAGNDIATISQFSRGTLNMGAGNDSLIVTGDNQTVNATGTQGINGGVGIDTIILSGSGASLSLTEVVGVEVFDITGSGNNTLEDLTSNYVKSLGSPVYVRGNAGDVVDLGYNATGSNLTEQLGNFGTRWAQTAPNATTTTDADGTVHAYNAWQYGADTSTLVYIENSILTSNII